MPRPLVLTTDPSLLDELLRLAAAAGAEPDVADHVAAAVPLWRDAPLVVVGLDSAADAVAACRAAPGCTSSAPGRRTRRSGSTR
jgi:hypothetical protein